ncbi:MAG: aminoglycoside phosphotransferase family protein [Nitrospirae bacterium]|nr:aminoglycoside phosphotransferase family protein [Nitrospirota bacterium]
MEDDMRGKERILVIEDQISWFDSFKNILVSQLYEKRDIEMVGLKEIQDSHKNKDFFDNVSYCLVDLELGSGINKNRNDTYGLNIVLPTIREIAPWIPAACVSRYITGDDTIISDLSVSDFDGLYPKSIILDQKGEIGSDFNSEKWNGILRDLSIKRVAAMTGRSTVEINNLLNKVSKIKLKLSDHTRNIVNEFEDERFKEGVVLLGLGGSSLAINEIKGGFSGINVSIVVASGEDNRVPIFSYWLMKWSSNIGKLVEEIQAHKRMLQIGINRSLQVPLLHHNVVAWKGIGYIAYVFEENAKTALDFINDEGLDKFTNHIETIVSLYKKPKRDTFIPREELIKWAGFDESRADLIDSNSLANTFELSGALIHGDLHLRNILIKDNIPALIDFARSDYAPIAIDIAKLAVDILVFHDKAGLRDISFLDWETLKESPLSGILNVYKDYLTGKGDIKFFDLALKAYALGYTNYPDVSEEIKATLKKIVRNQR